MAAGTGQDLLDRMELINQDLQLQSGETDVTRGLLALNVAQDYLEMRAAQMPQCYPTITPSGFGSFLNATTTANKPYIDLDDSVLRVDGIQYAENVSSLVGVSTVPKWDLTPRYGVGWQVGPLIDQLQSNLNTTYGKPKAYWQQGYRLWLDPIPDGTYYLNIYGLTSASNITASGALSYGPVFYLPLASFAVALMRVGLDDPPQTYSQLAASTFDDCLKAQIRGMNRQQAAPLAYTSDHRF